VARALSGHTEGVLPELLVLTCFGAAARDPEVPCTNPTRTVTPSVAQARRLPNSPCRRIDPGPPSVCWFGAPDGSETIALVGDSHAGHWRAAFEHAATARGWSAVSITHSSCPLQKALRDLREPRRTRCRRWKDATFAWLAAHPEIRTVFVAGLAGGTGVVPRRGESRFAAGVRGYRDAWAALDESDAAAHGAAAAGGTAAAAGGTAAARGAAARGAAAAGGTAARGAAARSAAAGGAARGEAAARAVAVGGGGRRIVVLRDTPAFRGDTDACIVRAVRRKRKPGVVCAVSRAFALRRDPAVIAARQTGREVVDLSSFFCDRRRCYPVIGGALVVRDANHMTGTYSRTLGPYLLRALTGS
jgi:hypothetical protein